MNKRGTYQRRPLSCAHGHGQHDLRALLYDLQTLFRALQRIAVSTAGYEAHLCGSCFNDKTQCLINNN